MVVFELNRAIFKFHLVPAPYVFNHGIQSHQIGEPYRKAIRKLYNKTAANAMRIQYGGSMNAKNASELMAIPEIDGGLIGGASLKAEDFAKVVNY